MHAEVTKKTLHFHICLCDLLSKFYEFSILGGFHGKPNICCLTLNQKVILQQMIATNTIKVVNLNSIVLDVMSLKISSMEATTHVPTAPRSLRQNKSTTKEKKPVEKEKQPFVKEKKKKFVPLRMSPRNNIEVRQKEKTEK